MSTPSDLPLSPYTVDEDYWDRIAAEVSYLTTRHDLPRYLAWGVAMIDVLADVIADRSETPTDDDEFVP